MPNTNTAKKVKTKYTKAKLKKELPLHLMILPGLILVLIFFLCSDGWIDHCISEVYPE